MESVNNNQFEVVPNSKIKRKITTPCTNVYLNPALDLLANEDPMCNTAMEIIPNKKRRRTKSCEIAAFENTALDLGISKAAISEFLTRELENVKRNIRSYDVPSIVDTKVSVNDESKGRSNEELVSVEPIYQNVTEITASKDMAMTGSFDQTDVHETMELSKIEPDESEIEMDSGISVSQKVSNTIDNKAINDIDISAITNVTNVQNNVNNQIFINNPSNLSLSFIDRLALDSPQISNQSLCFDDDLNESNIMEIKTITIITKKKRIPEKKKNTNPFLDPNLDINIDSDTTDNPFLNDMTRSEMEYTTEAVSRPIESTILQANAIMPRRLFSGDTNSTISTVNESSITIDSQNEYENIDNYRSDSPVYENMDEYEPNFSKQSKILGCDVSQFSASDIMNLNKIKNQVNSSNESTDSKKDLKHQILKASKLPKKVLKKIKNSFKTEKVDHNNTTLNPYEVPRKPPKNKTVEVKKQAGIDNPVLNLNNSADIDIEELEHDEEHQYETIKTIRNTQLNMNLTPLREKFIDNEITQNKTLTPSKRVRFDTTMNTEKVITGNSFDYGVQSPGFDAKIDKYHDELENCINERKYLQQNM